MDFSVVDPRAGTQHGLITTSQLYDLGASDGWIRYHVRSRHLVPVRRGVFRVMGAPVTQDQAWLAAVLSAGSDTVISHETAAAAWSLRGFDVPDRIDLLTTREAPHLRGVRGHQTKMLGNRHQTVLRRIPITTAERTLIDVSGVLHPWILGRVVDDAIRRKLVSLRTLVQCFEEVPVSGRRPSREMKDVLAERAPGFHAGGSAAELDVLVVLRRAGIRPLPVQQYRVTVEGHTYFLDYAWPESKHAIEFDGGGFHDTISAFHDDRERWRRLMRADWTVWAVTSRTSDNELVAIGVEATADPTALDGNSR